MATKKQKRAALDERRERRLAEARESGLRAQREDHERRDKQKRKYQKEQHDRDHSDKKVDLSCIHCRDTLKDVGKQANSSE
jgi:hypothetical protein